MKKLIIINGTMGSGKTATCNRLIKLLQPNAFLDGDWCWNMNPFVVNDETKKMVLRNICFILNSFLNCSEYKYIIFCWVMHKKEIMDGVIDNLVLKNTKTYKFTLSITEAALTERLMKDVSRNERNPDIIERSVARIKLYEHMNTTKIDVSNINPAQAAGEIAKLVGS
jgi:broad-specificity NMP kinase